MLGRVSQEKFQILYDGDALTSGFMDVYDLAPALLSVGDLVKDANAILNGKDSSASVFVESDFKRGSFEISLILDQFRTATILPGHEVGAAGLVALLFGTIAKHKEIVSSLFELWKKLGGEKPKEIIHNQSNGLTLIVTGNDNRIEVKPEIATLYEDDKARQATAKILSPVGKHGVNKFEARKDRQVLSSIEKSELPEWIKQDSSESAELVADSVEANTRNTLLTIVRPNFDKKGQWGFAEGSAKFSAKMEDKEFLGKVRNREVSFLSGDIFRVRLRTEQAIDSDGKVKTSHIVEQIVQHSARQDTQLRLTGSDRENKKDQKLLPSPKK